MTIGRRCCCLVLICTLAVAALLAKTGFAESWNSDVDNPSSGDVDWQRAVTGQSDAAPNDARDKPQSAEDLFTDKKAAAKTAWSAKGPRQQNQKQSSAVGMTAILVGSALALLVQESLPLPLDIFGLWQGRCDQRY